MNPAIDHALRAGGSACIAFAGAGGKTTAMFSLARSLPQPVIVTATTHLGTWQTSLADRHIVTDGDTPPVELEQGMQGVVLVTGEPEADRTRPVSAGLLDGLHRWCGDHALPLLVEADGSRQKPLKAWAEHEPAIPAFVDQVVQVAGLSALQQPLTERTVHRAEIFARLSGLESGLRISEESLIRVLLHPQGGLKNIPEQARRVVLLNQADTGELQAAARGMVKPLLSVYDSVLIAGLRAGRIYAVHEPTAAIILAAGGSSRYGRIKQLLDWRGEPFVRAVARTALEAGCSPVIVVTGSNAGQVEPAVKDLDVLIAHNADWSQGQAGSIRAGLIPAQQAGAAIFLLADQPQVTPSVLRALMEKHAQGLPPIVAPMVMDRRANPVLFDRATFPDLRRLQGDVGGRGIFHQHRVEYLPWHDDRLLLDVDTPEMYRRLVSDESL